MGLPLNQIEFKQHPEVSLAFFDFFPTDWKETLFPQWERLSSTTKAYFLEYHSEVITVGLVFSKNYPEFSAVEKEAFSCLAPMPYLGYVFTLPKYRKQGLGRLWFEQLFKHFPEQNYWLSIEDLNLEQFYLNVGFTLWNTTTLTDEKVFTRF